MGGKVKQSQRTKNNAKPSSSSRSAELLGTAVPNFVGFSAHSDLGLIPFAPGFGTADHMPDSFDSSINPQFQMILRKMSKKDPMTKKKALQEFIELVNTSDIDTIKAILPLWPKFYQNLAADTEHNVRELTQTALQLLLSKCKRAIAPYLKQLVPMWLISHFDNYAPAASIAIASFRDTFAVNANRTQEVCLHCQTEIIEQTARNLTFHTAATLSSGKGIMPEEAEQKYQRVVVCSLKALSFFVEHTKDAPDLTQVQTSLQSLLAHPKFWSYAKHKLPVVKAAWFEFVYSLLQSSNLADTVLQTKSQLITVCFQNIDESDPLVAPHVWGCILLLQSLYGDWHATLNFKTIIMPKLSSLLRNGFNRNTQAVCPNLLPFFSKLTTESLHDINWNEFCKQFFDDIKYSICTQDPFSKTNYSTIIKTYFECLRFLLQKLNKKTDRSTEEDALATQLLQENVLEPIAWCLHSENVYVKFFFLHTSALVAFWTDRQSSTSSDNSSCFYKKLLSTFWKQIFSLITEGIIHKDVDDHFLEHVLELVHYLRSANSSFEDQRVKFAEDAEKDAGGKGVKDKNKETSLNSAGFIEKELKQLVVQLVSLCLDNVKNQKSSKYIHHVRELTKMFPDKDFFDSITSEKTLTATLNLLVSLIDVLDDDEASEIVVDIIFEVLQFLEKEQRFAYIKSNLLKIPKSQIQTWVLQRLLSYPLCIEPEVQKILAEPAASTIIVNIAHDLLSENEKEKFNLLHKCFFQTDAGEILISSTTVDAILNIISEPLAAAELNDMVDAYGSFIAQIMPVVCTNGNSSKTVQREVFLKLFKFTMERTANDFISEDTLWEITTCWQDALSSEDIVLDETLLKTCADIVEQRSKTEDLTPSAIDSMAEAMAKFITCSTENIHDEDERGAKIDSAIMAFLYSEANAAKVVQNLDEFTLFLESLKGKVSLGVDLSEIAMHYAETAPILRRTLLNFCTIFKLVCLINTDQKDRTLTAASDDEVTEDYCDPNENLLKHWSEMLFDEIMKCINVAGMANSLINNAPQLDAVVETLMLELTEKVKLFMGNGSEIVSQIKERMLQQAAKEYNIATCRSLVYLVNFEQYAQFEENSTILLAEDLSEYFVTKNALRAYVNSLQYLLPNLEPRSISCQSPIMRSNPNEIWVKASVFRCLVSNNFNGSFNEKSDKDIIVSTLQFVTEIAEMQHKQKDLLLYNVEIHKQQFKTVIDVVEYVNLLIEVLEQFPLELTIKNWDAIRIGISSWVLSISKSIENFTSPKVSLFIVSAFKLFAALTKFIISEKQKSSNELLKSVIEEWENLFAREVNLVLFKSFYTLCNSQELVGENIDCYSALLDEVIPAVELIDYNIVYNFCKNSTKITLDNICNFLLKNLSNPIHCVRTTCVHILRQLTRSFVAEDIETFEKESETLDGQGQIAKWHFLNRFEDYITRYDFPIRKYLKEFSFKQTEIPDFEPIERNEALSYLLLWDCIIYACANSPVSLRSVYTQWLNENKYEENLLNFLFRAMPVEILKNYNSKIMNSDIFKGLTWMQITDRNLSLEKYVCHVYTEVLRKLPAVVRKWWNTSPSRQKAFVDKLTTIFISPLICNEELKTIGNKKEKHENMQVTVHISTREVLAVYSIDEARMELVITLAQNYPLGSVKVECGKQIGGRSSSRNVGMQLTIFLTHQNGTIFDGLTLWKNNLDKKFEGVEECYVCYTVIHQDTCQLPKLTCKTCKKKFHGPCLYKWFTTSSKSTCPICRNVF